MSQKARLDDLISLPHSNPGSYRAHWTGPAYLLWESFPIFHFIPNLLVSLSSSPFILLCSSEIWVLKSLQDSLQFYVQVQSDCSTSKPPIMEFVPFETANSKIFQPKIFSSNFFQLRQVLDLFCSFPEASYCCAFSKITQYQQAQPISSFIVAVELILLLNLGPSHFIHTHTFYFENT